MMYLFRRWLYRPLMRFAHRYNWHYAPAAGPAHGDNYCLQQHWCQWCGLRGDLILIDRVQVLAAPDAAEGERK